jgi:hypothetical protein
VVAVASWREGVGVDYARVRKLGLSWTIDVDVISAGGALVGAALSLGMSATDLEDELLMSREELVQVVAGTRDLGAWESERLARLVPSLWEVHCERV